MSERSANKETSDAAAATTVNSQQLQQNNATNATDVTTTTTNCNGKEALVPQLAHHGITQDELEVAIRVLNAVSTLLPSKKKRAASSSDNNKKRKAPPPGNGGSNSDLKDDNTNQQQQEKQGEKQQQEDGLEQYKAKNLRPLRKALAACFELHKRGMFQGKEEQEHYDQQLQARSLKRQKHAEQAQHQKYLATTLLRKGRVEKLRQLQEEAADEEHDKMRMLTAMMIPDGHIDTETVVAGGTNNKTQLLIENTTTEQSEEKSAAPSDEAQQPKVQLPKLRSCYVCKVRFRELHEFYDQLCPACAALNWQKRHQSANLKGRTAVVTGARVKIGLRVALKLLRAGCDMVIATTRFPNAAVAAYRSQEDFDSFRDRLHIYGLDLRDVQGLEAFTRYLKTKLSHCGLDILINNACQTIRRPAAYYAPQVEKELQLWAQGDARHKALLADCLEFEHLRRRILLDQKQEASASGHQQANATKSPAIMPLMNSSVPDQKMALPVASAKVETIDEGDDGDDVEEITTAQLTVAFKAKETKTTQLTAATDPNETPFVSTGLSHSAAMSQMVVLPEDVGVSDNVLPRGLNDINNQQLDLRTTNSWLLKMGDVSTPEMMECMLINAIAPFVLNSRLLPLMTTYPPRNGNGEEANDKDGKVTPLDRYIINVSAMEGKFYRYKMPSHPHTNMAKAALNMMTRTSAKDLAERCGIYMNAVDTGWINDENPLEKASKTARENLFQTPVDEVDAAARIVDPIFVGVQLAPGEPREYGKFLKDYRETEW